MSIAIRPLSPHVGAEVSGLDLSAPISASDAEALRRAFAQHHLLLLRQDRLSEQDQIRFSRLFGRLLVRNSYDGSIGKEAWYISNNRPDGALPVGEIEFHHDHIFYSEPLRAGVLYAIEVPASGSATRFRNVSTLLERLPATLRRKAEAVRCLHYFAYDDNYAGRQDRSKRTERSQEAWHPMVWQDPESGRRALWIARISTVAYEGIDHEAGEALLEEFWQLAAEMHDIEYTHQWRIGDLLIWDNRMLAHARLPFQASEPRTLRRTSVI